MNLNIILKIENILTYLIVNQKGSAERNMLKERGVLNSLVSEKARSI